MQQPAKIIGLKHHGRINYAMFINIRKFSSPEEVKILTEKARISPYQAYKYLLISPLGGMSEGEAVFTNSPGSLFPREPYILSFDFLRERWDDIPSGVIINMEMVIEWGNTGWSGDISRYLTAVDEAN